MSHNLLAGAVLGACATLWAGASVSLAADVSFTEVARETFGGVHQMNPLISVALSEDGKVAFAGKSATSADQIITWTGGAPLVNTIGSAGFSVLNDLQINSAGHVPFVARRSDSGTTYSGVYRTNTAAAAAVTLHEVTQTFDPGPAARFVTLSDNGTVAYSTIVSSEGAIYRGPVTGAQTVLRNGSGTFYNTQRLDVNNAGHVAVQMEYTSPVGGLRRAIFRFESNTPGTDAQVLAATNTAIEQTSVGEQPMPAINSAGQVAFSLNSTVTMRFYNPPNVVGPDYVETVLQPGVYLTTPNDHGLPRSYTQIANASGDFKTFDRVLLNDNGLILFEATLDDNTPGFYSGGNPLTDKILEKGDLIGLTDVSVLDLGELNNANQFTFMTTDALTNQRQAWIAVVPEPTCLGAAALAGAVLLRRQRRREIA